MRNALTTSSLLGLAAVGLLAGCPDRTISEVNPEQGRVDYKDIPVTVNRNVDILFIVDDSPSMADKQANVRSNFPNFVNVLNTIQGGLPDVHIGVVSSDIGTKGAEDASPGGSIGQIGNGGCSGNGKAGNLQVGQAGGDINMPSTYISDLKQADGSRQKNYNGDLAQVFGRMATLGAGGCGFEQHLEAMKRALNNNPSNAGFLRPDAFLAVIFIADEDSCDLAHSTLLGPESPALGVLQSERCTRFGVRCENGGGSTDQMHQVGTKSQCSPRDDSAYLTKVSDYVKFLKGLKPDVSKIIVAGILGNTEPFQIELRSPPGGGSPVPALAHSCTYQGANGPEVADPPIRIKYFLDQFPNRSTFTTICQQDLSGGLQLIAQLLKTALGNPCFDDVELAEPYVCSVSDVTNYLKPNQSEKIIPPCGKGAIPCWKIDRDPAKCPIGKNLILTIDRNNVAPPPETHVISNCVTQPK